MRIAIYSLEKILYQGEGKSLNCMTKGGEVTVLDNHRPFISILKKGIAIIIDETDREHFVPIHTGFIEVRPHSEVRLIVEEEAN